LGEKKKKTRAKVYIMPLPRLAALAGKVNGRRKKDRSAQKRRIREKKKRKETGFAHC